MEVIQKILTAVDFSDLTDKVLDAAINMAQKFDAELRILYVVEDMTPYAWVSVPHISFDVLELEMNRSAEVKLEKLRLEKLPAGLVCRTEVRKGSPAKEIVDCASSESCSLIVMGTHGYGGMEKMLLGSVADQVLKSAPCPVLVVR
jgi:universal stress protein A